MKTIVVYNSQTGFTKQYAQWIAEELQCSAVSLKEVSERQIREAELVIYGGWVFGGTISGLEDMLKKNPAKLVVFAVGAMDSKLVDLSAMKEKNYLENVSFFYMNGGFRFDKLKFPVRMMLKMLRKSIAKKEDKTEQDKFMEKALGKSFDAADKNQIGELVQLCREGSV